MLFNKSLLLTIILLFCTLISPTSPAFAGRVPAEKTVNVTPKSKKIKRSKKQKRSNRKKRQRIQQSMIYWPDLLLGIGITVELGAAFLWLFGFLAGFSTLMFIGLGILLLMGLVPTIGFANLGLALNSITVMTLTSIVIGLFLLGFFVGVSWLSIFTSVLLLLIVIITIFLIYLAANV